MQEDKIRKMVREGYAGIAKRKSCCCGPVASKQIGYSEKDLRGLPEGTVSSLGCGNPVALASLKEGETVLDLGSGGGLDCFLAARKVGKKGKVIGVDMTPEMLDRARKSTRKGGYDNVEFRLGEIENLPVADNTADVIISNCVINLSPNKGQVFKEAFRALKLGGRLMVSDITLLKELPDVVRRSVQAYVSCVAGAVLKDKYIELIEQAGFKDVRIVEETHYPSEAIANTSEAKAVKVTGLSTKKAREIAKAIVSIKVHAVKPKNV